MLKSSELRFLADENLNLKVVRPLSKLGYDFKTAPKGMKNGELLKLARDEFRSFISHDQDFLDSKRYPAKETAGMVVIMIHPQVESTVLIAIKKFLEKIDPIDLKGKLIILEKDGYITGSKRVSF